MFAALFIFALVTTYVTTELRKLIKIFVTYLFVLQCT